MTRSDSVTVIAEKVGTTISIEVSPISGVPPFNITISGFLKDIYGNFLDGKRVNLYENGAFKHALVTGLIAPGYYQVIFEITEVGTYEYYTEFPGDETHEGCEKANHVVATGAFPLPIWLIPVGIAVGLGVVYLATRK